MSDSLYHQKIQKLFYKKKGERTTNKLFLLVYAIFASFFVLNGNAILPYWNDGWVLAVILYMIIVSINLDAIENIPKYAKPNWKEAIIAFTFIFLFFTFVVFVIFRDLNLWFYNTTPKEGYQIISNIVFQIGIIATSEEIIFRGIILSEADKYLSPIFSAILVSTLFAVFHFASYNGSIPAMVIAFLISFVLIILTKKINIGAAIGFHAAYNLFLGGYTALSIIGGI